mmetsp:Transcript_27001/g.50922  ORF Transcript_27001/g.50922 Transcript_27001/m.50922 type:complete len:223 (+) Transcript_27001:109-777(+)
MTKALILLLAALNLAGAAQVARVLQEDEPFMGEIGAIPVDLICTSYMATGVLSCECERSGAMSVLLNCNQTLPSCTLGNETCIYVRFETVMDPITPNTQGSPYITTCTDWVTEERRLETCIEIIPDTVGRYNESIECGASLDGKVCKSCSKCEGYDYPAISVDCTNVQDKAEMTCGNVTEIGLAVLVFDEGLPQPEESAASSMGAMFALGSLLMSSLASMFW